MTEALLSGVLATAVEPAMALLPPHMASDKVRVMMLAIGLQESRLTHRAQIVFTDAKVNGADGRTRREKIKGPARGLWQFERGTKSSQGSPA